MPYGNVLLVDDTDANLYVAKRLLKLYKLQIDTAMSGRVALSKIKSGKAYDIVFMDHAMPDMDGIQAVRQLRDEGYKGKIVALTANAIVGQAEIFLQNGFDDFISKPIDIHRLDGVLNKYIRDKKRA
jgi:CheY-like chemotaxis protein